MRGGDGEGGREEEGWWWLGCSGWEEVVECDGGDDVCDVEEELGGEEDVIGFVQACVVDVVAVGWGVVNFASMRVFANQTYNVIHQL